MISLYFSEGESSRDNSRVDMTAYQKKRYETAEVLEKKVRRLKELAEEMETGLEVDPTGTLEWAPDEMQELNDEIKEIHKTWLEDDSAGLLQVFPRGSQGI
jgi:hypothetical protein